jgi:putative ABC transport system permease protein
MWFDRTRSDLRYAVRTLWRAPGFTAVVVVTLALALGANTAIFSVVYGILLRPLPYRDSTRLVLIQREQDITGARRPVQALFFSPADMDSWQQGLASLQSTSLYFTDAVALSTDNGSEVLATAVVSGSWFATLDGPILIGRPLGPADDQAPSIVISERLAQRLFGSVQDAIGQRLTLSAQPYTIVGVAGTEFQFPTADTEVWMPAGFVHTLHPQCCGSRMIGRLKPGESVARAAMEASELANTIGAAIPGTTGHLRATVVGLHDQMVDAVRPALLILFVAVGLVLIVACANVINLLLARYTARAREMAIRSALGASPRHLVAYALVESLLLAIAGAAGGVVVAIGSIAILARVAPAGVPRLDAVHVDLPVLLFSIGLAALAALGTGVLPAFRSANTADAVKWGPAGTTGTARGRRTRSVLCIIQLAVSLVLVVGAILLGRSLVRLLQNDLGVTTDHVVTASLNLAFGARPTDAQALARLDRVIERVGVLPGVQAAGLGTSLPPNASRLRVTLRRTGEEVDYLATAVAATPGYFRTLGMRLVKGRLFTEADDLNHPPVMIMSVDTAARFFGDGDPIGKAMSLPVTRNGGKGTELMTLVGVVANVKYSGLDAAPDDAVYRPFAQQTWVAPYLVARTVGDPEYLVTTLRREIAAVDRAIVLSDIKALDEIVSAAASQPRFRTVLLTAIAGLALLMASVGLYGVVAYSVAQRTREIGIRMALGADRSNLLHTTLREGLLLAVAGILCGLPAGYWATRTLTGLLYGIEPTDLASFGLASAGLLIVTLASSYVPARRATKVDPLIALRCE